MPKRLLALAVLLILAGITAVAISGPSSGRAAPLPPPEEKEILSPIYGVDRLYRSMTGPSSVETVHLGDPERPELLWITGYRAVMVGADGETPERQEFMCHSNLDIDAGDHQQALHAGNSFSPRLFTLSQGQLEVRFPAGFGIPILSSEPLSLTTQVLNHNHRGAPIEVRHKVTLAYRRDADLAAPLVPLMPLGAYGLALLEGDGAYFGVERPEAEVHGPGCLPGETASDHAYTDPLGRTFTGHWVVKPGREVNTTLVTHLMRLPYDTTIHAIAVHLHPYAESLELRDLTAGTTLFKSTARNFEDRVGLAHVEAFTSESGLAVYRDHQYELISVYDNTTDEDQDSMAVMYIYVRDRDVEERLRAESREGRRAGRAGIGG